MSDLTALAKKHKPVKMYLKQYLKRYEELFEPIRQDKLIILEIGVGGYKNPNRGGGSLCMWAEYFPDSQIIGVDINEKNLQLPSNAKYLQGSQSDVTFLNKLIEEYGYFDIVIDDGSHVTENTIAAFQELFGVTRNLYIIEDLWLKRAKGTKEYFENLEQADFETENMIVITKIDPDN